MKREDCAAGGVIVVGRESWLIVFEIGLTRLTRNNVSIFPLTLERARQIYPSLHKNMMLIGCGVEAPRQAPPRSEVKRIGRLLYLGRLVVHKRVDWLFDVLRVLAGEFSGVSLLIVGQGPEKKALVDQADKHGCLSRVVFRDVLSSDELRAAMASSDVLTFPSEQEGFGLVIIEAMAMGLPVVAADAPLSAARTIIKDGSNGLLVTSSREMACAIRNLITNKQLYHCLSREGLATAARYDWDSVVIPELESYYTTLVSR